MKLLLIGPDHSYTGGTGTMFKVMVDELRHAGVPFEVISSARQSQEESENWLLNSRLGWRVFLGVLRRARSTDVVTFHASFRAATIFGPLLALLSRMLGRRFVLRLFGGAFDREYERFGWIQRMWVRAGCRLTEAVLVETKMLYDYTSKRLPVRIVHFPNYTQIVDNAPVAARDACRRFIFSGRVIAEKGLHEIIAAAAELGSEADVDIYGPIEPAMRPYLAESALPPNVRYCGDRPFREIKEIMTAYDVQLLPSYYEGEGYPSAALEGFVAGLPLIGSYWRALPELVTNETGILVPPRDAARLAGAMRMMCRNPNLFRRLRAGALAQGRDFASRYWVRQFQLICAGTAGNSS